MKKLFALLVILALCGAANAAIVSTEDSVQVPMGGDIQTGTTLGLYTTTAILSYDIGIEATGSVTLNVSGITFPLVFEFAGKIVEGDPLGYTVRVSASQFFGGALGPNQIVNNIGVSGVGALEFYLMDEQGAPTSLGSVTVIPEPMTIAFLALGGLFIRRRN